MSQDWSPALFYTKNYVSREEESSEGNMRYLWSDIPSFVKQMVSVLHGTHSLSGKIWIDDNKWQKLSHQISKSSISRQDQVHKRLNIFDKE